MNKTLQHWIAVIAAAVFTAVSFVVILDAIDARSDLDNQLLESRKAATRRIDILQNELTEARNQNIDLQRRNAVLEGKP